MNKTLNRTDIVAIRDLAAVLAAAGDHGGANDALTPLVKSVGEAIAAQRCGPFFDITWHDTDFSFALRAWRDGIIEWKEAGFQGMTPGQIALSAVLDKLAEDHSLAWSPCLDIAYRDSLASDLVRGIARRVFGADAREQEALLNRVADEAYGIWYAEAMRNGIPPGIYAEFCYVPNWDGEDVDEMVGQLALRGTRWRGCYMDEVVPSESLKHLMRWVNVGSKELRAAVQSHRSADFPKFSAHFKGFTLLKDPLRPALVTAKQLIDIIENAGASLPVPMAHCEVELRALFEHDMRKPMALELKRGGCHIGMHDVINGSGYMDTWTGMGKVVVPPLHTGFGWKGRWRYGIDDVYGLVRSCFRCVPRELCAEDLREPEVASA